VAVEKLKWWKSAKIPSRQDDVREQEICRFEAVRQGVDALHL
jgi:hypothetical protein